MVQLMAKMMLHGTIRLWIVALTGMCLVSVTVVFDEFSLICSLEFCIITVIAVSVARCKSALYVVNMVKCRYVIYLHIHLYLSISIFAHLYQMSINMKSTKSRVMAVIPPLLRHECEILMKNSHLITTQNDRKAFIEEFFHCGSYSKQQVDKIIAHPRIGLPQSNNMRDCEKYFQYSPNDYMLMIDPLEVLNYTDDIQSMISINGTSVENQFLLIEYMMIVQRLWLSNALGSVAYDVFKVINMKLGQWAVRLETLLCSFLAVRETLYNIADGIGELTMACLMVACLPIKSSELLDHLYLDSYQKLQTSFMQISKVLQKLLIWSANPTTGIKTLCNTIVNALTQDKMQTRLPLLHDLLNMNLMHRDLHSPYNCMQSPSCESGMNALVCAILGVLKDCGNMTNSISVTPQGRTNIWWILGSKYNELEKCKASSQHDSNLSDHQRSIMLQINLLNTICSLHSHLHMYDERSIHRNIFEVKQQIYQLMISHFDNVNTRNLFEDILLWIDHQVNIEILSTTIGHSKQTWLFLDVAADPRMFYGYVVFFIMTCFKRLMEMSQGGADCGGSDRYHQRRFIKEAIITGQYILNAIELHPDKGEILEIKMLEMHCNYYLYTSYFYLPYIDQQHQLSRALQIAREWMKSYESLQQKNQFLGKDDKDYELTRKIHCIVLKCNCFISFIQALSHPQPFNRSTGHVIDSNFPYMQALLRSCLQYDWLTTLQLLDWTRLRLLHGYVKQVLNEVAFQWISLQAHGGNWEELPQRSGEMIAKFFPILRSYQSLRKVYESSMTWSDDIGINSSYHSSPNPVVLLQSLNQLSDEDIETIEHDMQLLVGDAEMMMIQYLSNVAKKRVHWIEEYS